MQKYQRLKKYQFFIQQKFFWIDFWTKFLDQAVGRNFLF